LLWSACRSVTSGLSFEELNELLEGRRRAKGENEDQTMVLVTLPEGAKFRVYVNVPGKRNRVLGAPLKIARSGFPGRLLD
jgi:hypothetical protein